MASFIRVALDVVYDRDRIDLHTLELSIAHVHGVRLVAEREGDGVVESPEAALVEMLKRLRGTYGPAVDEQGSTDELLADADLLIARAETS